MIASVLLNQLKLRGTHYTLISESNGAVTRQALILIYKFYYKIIYDDVPIIITLLHIKQVRHLMIDKHIQNLIHINYLKLSWTL